MHSVHVELEGIGRRLCGRALFEKISGRIGPGDCLAITGRNGAGKSTLLKMVAGLLRPDSGVIRFWRDERELDREERRRCQGMVSPEVCWYRELSGRENLLFIARLRGQRDAGADLEAYLARVGLAAEAHRPVGEYSTGMVQRLRFAALLLIKAQVWLLDEPTSNLDRAGKAMVENLVDEARRRDCTVLMATNEPGEAAYAGQVIHLG